MNLSLVPRVRVLVGAITIAIFATVAIAQKPKEPWDYLNEPAFKSAYTKALGAKSKTPWLAKRDGPAPLPSFKDVGGERFVMNAFCKQGDCGENSAVILYSPEKKSVYGTIYEKGKTTLIGEPPPTMATEPSKLWKQEWRKGP
jgi:hypothetical protein